MDRLSAWMVRASFVWLVLGVAAGGVMLSDAVVPGSWRAWFGPTHGHVLFVGWLAQFALGVACWLLPRRRGEGRPLGYDEQKAAVAVVALNIGLALRTVSEPLARAGVAAAPATGGEVVSALLQVVAVAIFVQQLWSRAAPRPATPKGAPRARDPNG